MTRFRMALLVLVVTVVALWCNGCRAVRIEPELPPIPASVPSQLGPVRVVWMDSLRDESGQPLWGAFAPGRRIIFLNTATRQNRAMTWQVYAHEVCHLRMYDTGFRYLVPEILAQSLCDLWATELVAELRRLSP